MPIKKCNLMWCYEGCKVKQEAVDWGTVKCFDKEENANEMVFSRPDFLLDSNWFGHSTERGREHSGLTDAIGALLGEDFGSEPLTVSK